MRSTPLGPCAILLALAGCSPQPRATEPPTAQEGERWLAGDHHVHSRFSVGWDDSVDPPRPMVGRDGIYPIPMNALMARSYGLSWMVSTDHGGPLHSKVNLEMAYPELVSSRDVVPGLIQFYGMELDTPGGEHSSLIIPHTHDEATRLFELEQRFARRDPWPPDSTRQRESFMLEALRAMRALPERPVVIANHPSRSANGLRSYGAYRPDELRGWNDTAPEVAVGMEGAPGHQASTLAPDGSLDSRAWRGGYGNYPTLGGFDQMTARLGGFWDSMLGEGRRWVITSTSDSHRNWREGGSDFWPGEYSKTYVWAERTHDSILRGIRSGRVFVTTGDLIAELYVSASSGGGRAEIGGTLATSSGADVEVSIRFVDPDADNARGRNPRVRRVDLIVGRVTGPSADRTTDLNPTTSVVRRWSAAEWSSDGAERSVRWVLPGVAQDLYLRVRGTNGDELEPEPDPRGEDPWSDLWFYSNAIFVDVR